jgi:parvulin-like peptidyl-prolyl isomerase
MRARFLLPALLLLTTTTVAVRAQTPPSPTTVMARAGEAKVTRAELDRFLHKYYAKTCLEQLINQSLLTLEASRRGVAVPEKDVVARLEEVKRAAGSGYKTNLDAEGITEDAFRDRLRYGLLAEAVLKARWPIKAEDLTQYTITVARLQTENTAKALIREAKVSNGQNFDILCLQQSIDKERTRIDNMQRVDFPAMYAALARSGITREKQISNPIEANGFWLVMRLEKVRSPDMLSPTQREQATRKVLAFRGPRLLPALRKEYKLDYPVSIASLSEDMRLPTSTVVATITGKGGDDSYTKADVTTFAYSYFARSALEKLIDRNILEQEAGRAQVSVSDAEVNQRVGAIKEGPAGSAYQSALDTEGITDAAFRERVHFTILGEKVFDKLHPATNRDLERFTVRYIQFRTQQQAQEAIRLLQSGQARFEQLHQSQYALNARRNPFVQPKIFFNLDNPRIVEYVQKLQAPAVVPEPIEDKPYWLVLTLEGRFGPDTLSAKERDSILRRLRTARMGGMVDELRKQYPVQYVVPVSALLSVGK